MLVPSIFISAVNTCYYDPIQVTQSAKLPQCTLSAGIIQAEAVEHRNASHTIKRREFQESIQELHRIRIKLIGHIVAEDKK